MGGEESKLKEKKKAEKCEVIASIDFGTRYTGYAFMFRSKASNFEVYKPQLTDLKREHTCIMLKKKLDGKFERVSFGNQAMENLIQLYKQENDDIYFFRLFKTAMVAKDTNIYVKDHKGREVEAEVVFANVYDFVCLSTLDFLKKSVSGGNRIKDDDILWMITIPATWGLMYRDFIRKAAEKSYHNIEIVLEPEAASMYIRNKPIECSIKGQKIEPFKNGQCYMLVDIGAGTTDICTHKVLPDGNLIEICTSSGINEGGEQVNKAFFNEFNKLFNKEVMDEFKRDNILRFYKLEKAFEDIKHKFKSDTNKAFVLILDEKLLNIFHKKTGRTFEIPSTFFDKLELENGDHLGLKPKFMASLFDPTISTISSKVYEQICESEKGKHTVCCIILSGGLSESDFVYDRISRTVADSSGVTTPVILSPNARIAVVEGALQMGLNPKGIVGRRSPYTYGFYSIIPFEEGKHPQHLKVIREGKQLCTAVFYKLFKKGVIVKKGDSFIRKSVTSYKTDKYVTRYISLWRSFKSSPKYCTQEEECEEAAKIEIPCPREGWPDRLDHVQRLIVLGNEFKIEFINENTKEKYECEIQYTF